MPPKLYASMMLGTPQAVESKPKSRKTKTPRALGSDTEDETHGVSAARVSANGKGKEPAEPTAGSAKPKRVLSEETKAKLRESRLRKAEEKRQRQQEEAAAAHRAAEEAAAAQAATEAKKAAAAEKRRLARLAKKEAAHTNGHANGNSSSNGVTDAQLDAALDEAFASQEKTPKKRKSPKKVTIAEDEAPPSKTRKPSPETDEAPPKWFNQFISKMMAEEEEQKGQKSSKKELATKAKHMAQTKWAQPYTREKMQHAADAHLTDMYSMIFG